MIVLYSYYIAITSEFGFNSSVIDHIGKGNKPFSRIHWKVQSWFYLLMQVLHVQSDAHGRNNENYCSLLNFISRNFMLEYSDT